MIRKAQTTERAVWTNIYSTSKATIKGMVSLFEALWSESELRQREERNRRQAELFQDILAHDIRNYTQISILNAELLKDEGLSQDERNKRIDEILKAADRTTTLINNAKKIGRILSSTRSRLVSVPLQDSIRRTIELVKRANPGRSIDLDLSIETSASVVADELLDEVIVNILSNSVNYTDKDVVRIEVKVEEYIDLSEEKRYWKILISDHGRGIPDEMKPVIYTVSSERAGQRSWNVDSPCSRCREVFWTVNIRNRVPDNFKLGTLIEIFLPQAV